MAPRPHPRSLLGSSDLPARPTPLRSSPQPPLSAAGAPDKAQLAPRAQVETPVLCLSFSLTSKARTEDAE
eukprot:CAMPEP_0170494654 /NCGR_PEP_ID=MMETSP0208-20121228/14765_1 /TAXON_ID=197538 /ORGANISM="Strombidium inclinatum, Strain S3" /LENGTH=69 /DNA_ID=CAMNT_0010770739 /DNA_START=20 /DNA_END=229 /DNA_ORIENTATION=+